ncbi:uncharacterized protein BT62DRAFT_1013890 [Guyanagaster necrorhizus]|uniref:Uncharacterized protein n=1 Tax=Guyanagaster necrorhizus TaxID=856835 RepID=A0A9P7VFA7_9AGAR|nr:uncharacterized protein BT62DRAFT_1013890 [Guyanagaster necrorhizus MCA 3950]KAG7439517.1 hypothetical protein BT62DRAFT_1013890 [Guyanagaster necrorhizus MCA 3950]
MPSIPLVQLNNSTEIPIIGIRGGPSAMIVEAYDATKDWVLMAIQAGYRHIDTALIGLGWCPPFGEAVGRTQ